MLALAGGSGPAVAGIYPFEGAWDCGVGVFTFTAQTYDPGGEEMEILDVARQGAVYVLSFADGYRLMLEMREDGLMEWVSGETGDSFTCQPLP
jgi:hypothetical protein